jgi:hypothetical protein
MRVKGIPYGFITQKQRRSSVCSTIKKKGKNTTRATITNTRQKLALFQHERREYLDFFSRLGTTFAKTPKTFCTPASLQNSV